MIKVPSAFAGISDLGFTAQYREQGWDEPMRDVPFLIEGPRPPMKILAQSLQLLRQAKGIDYSWSDPVMLSDETVVMAFRDCSLRREAGDEVAGMRSYVINLVKPVVFAFLRDCAGVANLRLSAMIEMQVHAPKSAGYIFNLPLHEIVPSNGENLLWQLA